MDATTGAAGARGRESDLAAAIRWCSASICWSTLAGIVAIVAGVAANSVALLGFGLESLLDGGASAVLARRFASELNGHEAPHHLERTAARLVGSLLALIVLYLVARATLALATHSEPSTTAIGIVLTAASLGALPLLAAAKLRLSRELDSPALRADGVLSAGGTALAGATLVGLALSGGLGLWWADSVAALVIAVMLARESVLTWRAAPSLTT